MKLRSAFCCWLFGAMFGFGVACFVFPPLAHAQAPEPFTFVVRIDHQETYDSKGIQFYALVDPGVGDASLLSVDGDLPLSKVLAAHAGQKVRISIEPIQLEQISK